MLKSVSIIAILYLSIIISNAQVTGFPQGRISVADLKMKIYPSDTSAVAVMLNEFGDARIENGNDFNLIFTYHVLLKILKTDGLEYANFEIPLRKNEQKKEALKSVQASSFNLDNSGSIQEVKLVAKNVFTEERNKYYDVKKFAVPGARVGSVIEIVYVLESPFLYNFRTWEFQSDIPKVQSEYWTTIPGNYRYHTTLKGFLNLEKNESELVRDCFSIGGGVADCAASKYAMSNIPAFEEEEYMTAKSNFLSSINYELEEIHYFDGRKNRITKEWKDVEEELRRDEDFGIQLRRGGNVVDKYVELSYGPTDEPLVKAQKIYELIKTKFTWNEVMGFHSEHGLKKAFETGSGNVGDINLTLIAALEHAGLDVEPMILSTRKNGLVIELFPVISDFNYVVAKLNIQDKVYLLDATDKLLSFGLLPERCLNGKGRVLGKKQSYWHEIKPQSKDRLISSTTLKLESDGKITGTFHLNHVGYDAVDKRKAIFAFGSHEAYIEKLQKNWHNVHIKKFDFKNLEDVNSSFSEKFEIEIEPDGTNSDHILFHPFMHNRWEKNPFKLANRLYPVDFGAPLEETFIITLEFPKEYEVVEIPKNIGLALPNSGGRLLMTTQMESNILTLSFSFQIAKTVYSAEEYQYLKELFNNVVQAQNSIVLLKLKNKFAEN
ncbi:DUF3857 domain-containing protein [Chryseosolibacter indicus]|uniref:DUF3857 domain-containing protein n=1 Tax=Chryseosolibacter indicus TaxID=2782351 RepID=A0ABS5VQJ0_9BACT|nr:DUF3857 domain-containing protein [Chryseosolibacter indicus]MBT1703719.1 DUF3857 domain-containing protein [Chryseosolibacter indicus]